MHCFVLTFMHTLTIHIILSYIIIGASTPMEFNSGGILAGLCIVLVLLVVSLVVITSLLVKIRSNTKS